VAIKSRVGNFAHAGFRICSLLFSSCLFVEDWEQAMSRLSLQLFGFSNVKLSVSEKKNYYLPIVFLL